METIGIIIAVALLVIVFHFRKQISSAIEIQCLELDTKLEEKRVANKAQRKLINEQNDALGDVPTADELLSKILNKSR